MNTSRNALLIFILVGYAVAFFLYYIDEGNYHFEGLAQPTEWIFVTLYALVFTGCFQLVFYFFKKIDLPFFGKLLLSVVLGLGILPLIFITVGFLVRIF